MSADDRPRAIRNFIRAWLVALLIVGGAVCYSNCVPLLYLIAGVIFAELFVFCRCVSSLTCVNVSSVNVSFGKAILGHTTSLKERAMPVNLSKVVV